MHILCIYQISAITDISLDLTATTVLIEITISIQFFTLIIRAAQKSNWLKATPSTPYIYLFSKNIHLNASPHFQELSYSFSLNSIGFQAVC